MKKYSLLAIILAVIVLAVGFLILKNGHTPTNINQPAAAAPTKNLIKFSGQAKIEMPATVPAGDELTITKVLMPGHGFVVIKDKAGKVVAASNLIIFPETDNFKMTVPLASGQTYIAELHGDNGDGVFNAPTDPPVVIGGKTISITFKVK